MLDIWDWSRRRLRRGCFSRMRRGRLFIGCDILSKFPLKGDESEGERNADSLCFVWCRTFEQASPHAIGLGSQADLSDLKIKRASE